MKNAYIHSYRKELLKGIREDVSLKLRSEKGTLDTVCGDGSKSDIPLRCVGLEPVACTFRRKMTVYAFDGQTMHVNSTSRVVYKVIYMKDLYLCMYVYVCIFIKDVCMNAGISTLASRLCCE